MALGGPRVLYVPNERGVARQFGFRRAFANLLSAGEVSAVSIFSLEWRIAEGGDAEGERRSLIRRVADFRPDIVLMQHMGATRLRMEHLELMREVGNFRAIYHEGDPYTRYVHPLPRAARAAGVWSDVVFTTGAGGFAANFRAAGAKRVMWVPSAFDPGRASIRPASLSTERNVDVVVVANRNRPRLRPLPNAFDRVKFVLELQRRLGPRLALFGRGWEGPSARGILPYSQQAEQLQSAWMSANWDHFAREPAYFSDRLAISLASGSVHATSNHPGYDDFFPQGASKFLVLGSSPLGLVDEIEQYFKTSSVDERQAAEAAARSFAFANLRQDDQLLEMLTSVVEGEKVARRDFDWNLEQPGLDET